MTATLIGRLVDLLGRQRLGGREVAVLARRVSPDGAHDRGDRPQVVLHTWTDEQGRFLAAAPGGHYVDAFALLGDGTGRIPLELEPDGTFPDEIVLFLNTLDSHLRHAAI